MSNNNDIFIKNIFIKKQNYILNKNELYIKNTFIDIYNDNIIEKFNKIRKVKSLNNILNNDEKFSENSYKTPENRHKTPPIKLFKNYQHFNKIPPFKLLYLDFKFNTNNRKKVLLIKILEYIKFITRNIIQLCKFYNNQNKINNYIKLYFSEINYYYLYIKIFIYNLI
jgi:hypothetical protein